MSYQQEPDPSRETSPLEWGNTKVEEWEVWSVWRTKDSFSDYSSFKFPLFRVTTAKRRIVRTSFVQCARKDAESIFESACQRIFWEKCQFERQGTFFCRAPLPTLTACISGITIHASTTANWVQNCKNVQVTNFEGYRK